MNTPLIPSEDFQVGTIIFDAAKASEGNHVEFAEETEAQVSNKNDCVTVSKGCILQTWKFFQRCADKYGMFCQDTIVQATFMVPQFIVYLKLSEQGKQCFAESTFFFAETAAGRFALDYDSVGNGRQTVTFNMDEIFSACGPFYQKLEIPINLMVTTIAFHHLVFFAVNVLKVSWTQAQRAIVISIPFYLPHLQFLGAIHNIF
jgi:hypothetical protein